METGKTYTDFKEWQKQYLIWRDQMPRYYNLKFLAINGIFCKEVNDDKEFMFPLYVEIDNLTKDEIEFAGICALEEIQKKIVSDWQEKN
jgi:hypothetical protein